MAKLYGLDMSARHNTIRKFKRKNRLCSNINTLQGRGSLPLFVEIPRDYSKPQVFSLLLLPRIYLIINIPSSIISMAWASHKK